MAPTSDQTLQQRIDQARAAVMPGGYDVGVEILAETLDELIDVTVTLQDHIRVQQEQIRELTRMLYKVAGVPEQP